MPLRDKSLFAAAAALVVGGGLVGLAPAAMADPVWSVVPSPPRAAENTSLDGVACVNTAGGVAGEACIAVGYGEVIDPHQEDPGVHGTAERWTGSAWAFTKPTGLLGRLLDVSCASATSCIAVGDQKSEPRQNSPYQPAAERWDGTSWSILTTVHPNALGDLSGIACTSATACTAVGMAGNPQRPLVERWDGTTWTMQTAPTLPVGAPSGRFDSVSCPTSNFCLAVGTDELPGGHQHSWAAAWRHNVWRTVPVPAPSGATDAALLGVDCTAADACQAVGFARGAPEAGLLAQAWDGAAFTLESVPAPEGASAGELTGVSCTSATSCRAVGDALESPGSTQPLAIVLDAATWSEQAVQTPRATTDAQLMDVTCSIDAGCTAVGTRAPGAGADVTLAEGSTDAVWSAQRTPFPRQTLDSRLEAVDCAAPSDCVSVGQSLDPLSDSWDGHHWTFTPAPLPPNAGSEPPRYNAVSCAPNGPCMAVGGAPVSVAGESPAFTAVLTPAGWSPQAAPVPAGAGYSDLTGVSCPSSTFCVAVGEWGGNDGGGAFADMFDGATWAVTSLAAADGSAQSVSCVSDTACLAVGGDPQFLGPAIALRWNGSTWQDVSPPASDNVTTLTAVSCRTATFCVAIEQRNGAPFYSLVATLRNGVWTEQAMTLPAGVTSVRLGGVSCPTGSATCTAVGSASNGSPAVARGNAGTWTAHVLPVPAGATTAALTSVRCFTASACESVGYSISHSGHAATLVERSG